MTRQLAIWVVLMTATTSSPARAKTRSETTPAMAPQSAGVTDDVLDAVATELERAMSKMKIPGAPAPYFISYKLTEVQVNDAVATLGATTGANKRHFIALEAHVHVGSYDSDNSNFLDSRAPDLDGIATLPLALESSPSQAQRVAWLATDAAYKEAVAQARAKRDALASGAALYDGVPSYTKARPVVSKAPPAVPALESLADIEKRAEMASRTFLRHPTLRDSRVAFTSFLERRWYINSEGTSASDVRRVSGVIMVASAQAPDGQEVALTFSRYAHTGAGLPDNDSLRARAENLAREVETLRSAPVVAAYSGPILFEGEGAVDAVRYGLAPHLSGTPAPIGVAADDDARLAGRLTDSIGLRILAPILNVFDDPTTNTIGGTHVIGGYQIDDEGAASQRVQVVKAGKLIQLLMSRTPNKEQRSTNGHARLSMPGGVFRGSATNLVVSGSKTVSKTMLRRKLISEAKARGLEYGIVVRKFDDPAMTATPELSRLALVQLLQSVNQEAPPPTLQTYRVYPDGKEELVRNAQLGPIDMRAWRDVVAVGNTTFVHNFLASTENPILVRLRGVQPGFVPSSGIESSITTPDLLFGELELRAASQSTFALPAVPSPLQ